MIEHLAQNAQRHLKWLRGRTFPWSSEESTLACQVIESLIEEKRRLNEELDNARRGISRARSDAGWRENIDRQGGA